MRFVVVAFAGSFAFSSAVCSCASEQVTWDQATAVEAPKDTAAKKEEKAGTTAAEYAAKFPTDGACETEARRIDQKNRELALKLLGACIERGDFKRLNALVEAPWTNQLRSLPQAAQWCARVVAARAGDVESDVKACNKAGVNVKTLEQVFTDPNNAKGSVIIFRGRLDEENRGKGREIRLIETVLEEGEVEAQATGRRLGATFGTQKQPGRDAVMLAKTLKLADDPSAEDGEPLAIVDVLGAFPAADSPTYN